MLLSEPAPAGRTPPSIENLARVPQQSYNYRHTIVQEAPVPARIVMWNPIDFAHVNFVHRRTYNHCRILAENTFYMSMPGFLRPLKRWINLYLEKWSEILWEEDSAILLRRQKVLECGFVDYPLDAEIKAKEGLF